MFTRLFHLQWVCPGFLVAFSIHRCLHDYGYLGFSWIDLDGYEGMRNVVAAFLQSLPTVILNSVLFALGNKPSHGIFLQWLVCCRHCGFLFSNAEVFSCRFVAGIQGEQECHERPWYCSDWRHIGSQSG